MIPPGFSHVDYPLTPRQMAALADTDLYVKVGHPAFDYESRIVQVERDDLVLASVYVPNGGKDYPAKLEFLHHDDATAQKLGFQGGTIEGPTICSLARTRRSVSSSTRATNSGARHEPSRSRTITTPCPR